MACTSHFKVMSPLARESGTRQQSTIDLVLMAIASEVLRVFMVISDRGEMYCSHAELILFAQCCRPQARTVKKAADLQLQPHPIPSHPGVVTMPRLRGKSRRGAA